ncbi:MAG: anti-sigma factor [Catenulispora sp.]|nr:anti-sigma factor [Catenulispora sp.]
MVEDKQQEQALAAEAAAVAEAAAEQEPLEAVELAVTRAARWRALADKQARAFHVLVLTCIVFGAATAAFAWTTIRVHDRQAAAENRGRDVAQVLSAADVHTVRQSAPSGGTFTAYYSAALGRAALVEHGMHNPPSGHTYAFWYVDSSGKTHAAGSSRFDHAVNDLVLLGAVPAGAKVEVTLEKSDAEQPTTAALVTLALG